MKEKKKTKLDHDVYEKRITKIAARYLQTSFFLDFFACVPVLIYEAMYKFSLEQETVILMIDSGWYKFWSFLKIFKLA